MKVTDLSFLASAVSGLRETRWNKEIFKAFFFGQRADAVVAEAVKIAVLIQQSDQTAVEVVTVLDLLSECIGTDEETTAFVVGVAGALLERIGMLKQSAFRIMQVVFPRAVCLDYSLWIAP